MIGPTSRPLARISFPHLVDASLVTIIIAIVVAIIGFAVGYAMGRARSQGSSPTAGVTTAGVTIAEKATAAAVIAASTEPAPASAPSTNADDVAKTPPSPSMVPVQPASLTDDHAVAERARIIRSYENEAASLRRALAGRDALITQLTDFAEERRRLFVELAAARGETARYRQVIVDLEDNSAPQFFGTGAPDDLKLIVGIGPVLERMLQMMGVSTYRQIARWTERDIDEFDAKLSEFPGRIRRDAWVTQARALHQSKYGEALPVRGRG
jgi:predicted flap endonuclease-1-like 5' DNA nuclease